MLYLIALFIILYALLKAYTPVLNRLHFLSLFPSVQESVFLTVQSVQQS